MRGVRLHAFAQLAYEGIMDDLAAGGGVATNAAPASASQGGCTKKQFFSVGLKGEEEDPAPPLPA